MKKLLLLLFLLTIFINFTNAKNLMIPFEQNGQIGFLNEDMQVLVYPEYSKILNQSENMFWVIKMDSNNRIIKNDIIFFDGIKIPVEGNSKIKFVGEKYYVIYKNQESVVYDNKLHKMVCSFKGYELNNSDSEDYIFITNITDGSKARYFFVDLKGNEYLVDNSYQRIVSYDTKSKSIVYVDAEWNESISDFNGIQKFDKIISEIGRIGDGLFLGYTKTQQGYFNLNGELVIPVNGIEQQKDNLCPVFCCSIIPCILDGNSIYVQESIVEENSKKWAIINTKGKIIKKNIDADYIFPYSTDKVSVMYKTRNNKKTYSLIDTKGNIITTKDFEYISEPVNGYARARSNNIDYLISTKNGNDYRVFEILVKSKDKDE